MVQKNQFKQIDEYAWELHKSYDSRMRAPVRIYGNREIFDRAFGDRSIQQLINVSMLPGIVKYAMAMPDMHQGYGFPIGGVAAFDYDEGIISPGGVGYDINCLSGESRILHKHGYTLSIAEMEHTWETAQLRCQEFEAQCEADTPIVRYFRQPPDTEVYRVVTETGEEIIATGDHPFWTLDGMKHLETLLPGESLALYPFEGVPYKESSDIIVVGEADIDRILKMLDKGKKGNAASQIKNHLRTRGLFPLRLNHSAMPHLLKLLGYVLGDGTLYFTGGKGKGTTWFYGEREDLEAIRQDIEALGFTPSRIYSRDREHKIVTSYDTYEFEHQETSFKVVGSSFAILLVALGAPVGSKAEQDFRVPSWLLEAPRWQQRLFLAAFFGAELSAPATFDEHGTNFYTPVLSMNKRERFVESGYSFMNDVSQMLDGFGVETKTISRRREQVNKDGSRSIRLRLILSSKSDSLINLWGRVGFEYNQKRRYLGLLAVQYLKLKQRHVAERHTVAQTAVAMQAAGVPPTQIFDELTDEHINKRFLERSLYEERKTGPRVGAHFPDFESYCIEATAGLGESGMVWSFIAHIEQVENFEADVYDFTVVHPDHNFVANCFVVSNCGVRMLASNIAF
ncbi:MAG: RNA-splicing ligase RtcB, partial [Chloroflexi bacterium]|nr:RNA-splicing ligase RtcB [Chloroflexota bacterium]